MPAVIDPGGDSFSSGDPPHGVCIAFDDDALADSPTWTRLDDPVGYRLATGWQISRGRQSELDKTSTGTATVTFRDLHGQLDPTNATGPFYGKLNPRNQAAIALWNPVTGTWHTIFTGFTSDQNHDLEMWTADRGLDTVTWELEDAFGFLANVLLTPGSHGDIPSLTDFADVYYHGIPANLAGEPDTFCHVDDRISQLLDDGGWPAAWRDIFSGNVSVQGVVYQRQDQLLTALLDAADAEFPGVANIFSTRLGDIAFRGRFARFNPENTGYGIAHWYVGGVAQALDDSSVVPIVGPVFPRRAQADIINAYLALPAGVDAADVPGNLVTDPTSIATYGYRNDAAENLLTSAGHNDDASPTTAVEETLKFAQYRVGNYKDPKTRISVLQFKGRGAESVNAEALWDLLCNVEIGDLISLETTHAGGGGFDEDFFVEGIRYTAAPARADMHEITLELDVSPRSFFGYNPFGDVDSGLS